ncbi:MAG: DUF4296 domain-containing protein [Bacteroidales bacterium]
MKGNLLLVFLAVTGIFLLMTFSCSPPKSKFDQKVPAHVITPDSMVLIISELQYAESLLRELKRVGRESQDRNMAMISRVFDSLGVSAGRYEQSLDYYEQHLTIYQEIYGEVIARLTQKQTEILDAKKNAEEKK